MSDKSIRDVHKIPISEAMTKNLVTTNKRNNVINYAKVLYL